MPELLETIGPRAGGAPLSNVLTELGTVDIESAFAVYDGTGASGAWLPALTIRAQNGAILSRTFPSTEMAAGDAAVVSFVPLGLAEASSGGSGIQFDTFPQDGDWLAWNTTAATGSPSGYGLRIQDASDAGILLEHTGAGSGQVLIESDNGDVTISADTGDATLTGGGGGVVLVEQLGDGQVLISSRGTGGNAVFLRSRDDGNIRLENEGDGNVIIENDGNGSIRLLLDGTGFLTITGLPIANPGGTDRVWNNGGVLNIT